MSEIRLLGNVSQIVPGFAFNESFQGKSNLPIPFIKVSDFAGANDSWIDRAVNTVDNEIMLQLRARAYPYGTIIFPKVGGALLTNKRARLKITATFDNNVMGLIPTAIDQDYLYYFMCSFDMAKLANTQSLPSVRVSDVAKIEIPYPTLDDQRRIATHLKAKLATVEEARAAAQTQLDDARRLIPAILKAAFSETDNADRVKIGDVAQTSSGSTPSRDHKKYWEPAEFPWVKTGEVVFEPIRNTTEKVSLQALKECSLPLLPKGTVLLAMYGQGKTRGQSAVLEIEATTNQACFAIFPNATFDSEYLQFWLRHSYEDLRTLSDSRGGNQSNLNGSILNQFEVPLVPCEKQKSIVKHIKEAVAEAQILQNGLQQQLKEIELLPSILLAKAFDSAA